MKASVAIALIICGLLLMMLPAISDYLFRQDLVRLLEKTGSRTVSLQGEMEGGYKVGCFLVGLACIVVAIRNSTRRDVASV